MGEAASSQPLPPGRCPVRGGLVPGGDDQRLHFSAYEAVCQGCGFCRARLSRSQDAALRSPCSQTQRSMALTRGKPPSQKLEVGIQNGEGALTEKDPKDVYDTLVSEKEFVN